MQISQWTQREAQRTLSRLLPRIEPVLSNPEDYRIFLTRIHDHFPRLFALLFELYGNRYDFFYHLEQILLTTAQSFSERNEDLRALDVRREDDPFWYESEKMVGGVAYVDLFANDLEGIRQKIPYFKELGLTYIHLMPLFRAPSVNSDGGYAVSDFRKVNPQLGTMGGLNKLAAELRHNGISLVLDFVFNHTSDEHQWALNALAGDEEYQDYYYLFPDRTMPDQYERNLREIFPDQAPGNFTYQPTLEKWAWTTFNNFQWDLNYQNPATFNAMLGEMLFLANQGVEILRLDAVAFVWKQLGTNCENLPQAHLIIQAFNALTRIAAPSMLFKSEAIVHPRDVASYISLEECPISYNPTFMALIWEALATREVKLLRHSMSKRFDLPEGTAWVNYVRVHDDIGWSFADEDANELGIQGFDHRQFLNQYYLGMFPGSFATGLSFGYNPNNLDMRICGTSASLAGLEKSLELGEKHAIEFSIRRILMIHSLIMSAGGIPLIYLGDEIATLNDYSYKNDPGKAQDDRWVHRPRFNWNRAELRSDSATIEGRIFQAFKHMIFVRKHTPQLADNNTLFFDTQNPHVLAFGRNTEVLVLANFSEYEQTIQPEIVNAYFSITPTMTDLLTGSTVHMDSVLQLEPYQYLWLVRK